MRRWLLPLLALAIAAVLVLLDRAGRDDGAAGIDSGPQSPIGSVPEFDDDIQAPQPDATGTDPTRVAVDAGDDSVAAPTGQAAQDLGLDLQVRDETGAPVTSVAFYLWRVENGRPLEEGRQELTMGSTQGEYRLYGMTSGKWTVVVDGEPSGWPAGIGRAHLSLDLPYEGPRLDVVLTHPGTLAGRVENSEGEPLTGVNVRAWLTEPRTRRSTPTDEQGEFQLGRVRPGQWKLIAELRGSKTEQMVEVLPGSDSYQVLRFERAGAIEGLLLYEGGEPLPGWRVSLIGGNSRVDRVQTDEDGSFRFAPVAAGTYSLVASNTGEPGTRPTPREYLATATAVVVADETVQVTIVKALFVERVEVHGTLTLGGEPVAKVGISAFREGEHMIGIPYSDRTDAQGNYSIRLPGPGPVLFRADSSWAQATLALVQVPPGPQFRLDLSLPAGSVSGELIDTQGYPWRWQVTLEPEDGSPALPSVGSNTGLRVDDDGSFLFPAVQPGTYVLRAHGGAGWSVPPLGGIRVEEGQEVTGLELTARPGGGLSGRVTDAEGELVAGAEVIVRDLAGVQLVGAPCPTSAHGLYFFNGLPAGRVLVSAQTEDGTAQIEVRITAEGRQEANLRLGPGTVLTISAVDESGTPLPTGFGVFGPRGESVTALIGPGRRTSSFANPLSFSTHTLGPLPPGTYRVVARSADGRQATREVELRAEPTLELTLELR